MIFTWHHKFCRYHYRFDAIDDKSRFQNRFAESQIRHCSGLVPPHEFRLLHRHSPGICRCTLLHEGDDFAIIAILFATLLEREREIQVLNATLSLNFQIGSGEIPLDDEEWEEWESIASQQFEDTFRKMISCNPQAVHPEIVDASIRRRGSLVSALYNVSLTCR